MIKAKLIKIEKDLQYKMRIARDLEAMKGREISLDKFYEEIVQAGLKLHNENVTKAKQPGK